MQKKNKDPNTQNNKAEFDFFAQLDELTDFTQNDEDSVTEDLSDESQITFENNTTSSPVIPVTYEISNNQKKGMFKRLVDKVVGKEADDYFASVEATTTPEPQDLEHNEVYIGTPVEQEPLNLSLEPEPSEEFEDAQDYNYDYDHFAQPEAQVPTASVDQVPVAPVEQVPTIPVDQVPVVPVDQVPTIPVDQVPVAPVDQVPTIPVDQVPLAPVDQVPTEQVAREQEDQVDEENREQGEALSQEHFSENVAEQETHFVAPENETTVSPNLDTEHLNLTASVPPEEEDPFTDLYQEVTAEHDDIEPSLTISPKQAPVVSQGTGINLAGGVDQWLENVYKDDSSSAEEVDELEEYEAYSDDEQVVYADDELVADAEQELDEDQEEEANTAAEPDNLEQLLQGISEQERELLLSQLSSFASEQNVDIDQQIAALQREIEAQKEELYGYESDEDLPASLEDFDFQGIQKEFSNPLATPEADALAEKKLAQAKAFLKGYKEDQEYLQHTDDPLASTFALRASGEGHDFNEEDELDFGSQTITSLVMREQELKEQEERKRLEEIRAKYPYEIGEVTLPEQEEESEATQAEETQAEPVKPEVVQPEVAQPEVAQPEVVQPEVVQPEVVQPEVVQPEVVQPEVVQPEVVQPEVVQPEVVQPEVVQPEVVQPEVVQPEVVQSEVVQPEVVQPEVVEPEVVQPEVVQPEVVQPEVVQPEVVQPEVVQPEAVQPEVVQPEVVQPEVVEPEVVEPETTEQVEAEPAPTQSSREEATGLQTPGAQVDSDLDLPEEQLAYEGLPLVGSRTEPKVVNDKGEIDFSFLDSEPSKVKYQDPFSKDQRTKTGSIFGSAQNHEPEPTPEPEADSKLTQAFANAGQGAFNLTNLMQKAQEKKPSNLPGKEILLPSQIFDDDNKQLNDYVRFLRQSLDKVTHGAQILGRQKIADAHRYEIKLLPGEDAKRFVKDFNRRFDRRKLKASFEEKSQKIYVDRFINTSVNLIDLFTDYEPGTNTIGVGLDKNAHPFKVKFEQSNTLIVGSSSEAKANLLSEIMMGLAYTNTPEQIEFLAYCDDSRHQMFKLNDLPHFIHPVLMQDQVQELIALVYAELIRRRRLCTQLNAGDYINYNHFLSLGNLYSENKLDAIRPLYVFIDGISHIMVAHCVTLNVPNYTLATLVYLLNQGKRYGINFIVVNNTPEFNVLNREDISQNQFTLRGNQMRELKSNEFIFNNHKDNIYTSATVDEQEMVNLIDFWNDKVYQGTIDSNARGYNTEELVTPEFYRFVVSDELIFSGSLKDKGLAQYLNYDLNGEIYKGIISDLEEQGTLIKRNDRNFINGNYAAYLKSPLANTFALGDTEAVD